MSRRILISGCSGGGKSTLLSTLAARGFCVVEEPGRRIVRQERDSGGQALPWTDMAAFARRAMAMATEDFLKAGAQPGWTFFDRGLVDAAAALGQATGEPIDHARLMTHRYHASVFLAPPWPEIYVDDPERRHGFVEAVAEYDRLAGLFPALGYETVLLPKASPDVRADFVISRL